MRGLLVSLTTLCHYTNKRRHVEQENVLHVTATFVNVIHATCVTYTALQQDTRTESIFPAR